MTGGAAARDAFRRSALGLCLSALLASAAALPSRAAEQAPDVRQVTRASEAGVELRIFEADGGYLVDAGFVEVLPRSDVRFFLGDEDVTESAETRSPLGEIVYLFSGGDAVQQCRAKLRLDAALAVTGLTDIAIVETANELCPEMGLLAPAGSWPGLPAKEIGYRRVLVIEVSDGTVTPAFAESHPFEWARLPLTYADLEEAGPLIESLTAFVEPGLAGFLSFVPAAPAERGRAIKVAFYRDGSEWLAVESPAAPPQEIEALFRDLLAKAGLDSRSAGLVAIGVGLLLILLAGMAWRAWRRKASAAAAEETPLRAVRIGYGHGCDYSLGGQEDKAVARVELYRDGRRRVVRLTADESIGIDGVEISAAAWVDPADELTIAGKKVVLV